MKIEFVVASKCCVMSIYRNFVTHSEHLPISDLWVHCEFADLYGACLGGCFMLKFRLGLVYLNLFVLWCMSQYLVWEPG